MRSELDFDHARACGSSHWGRIDEILFVSIVQILPVKDTIACESVCRSWRSQLRDRPASSVWCSALALRDSGSQAGKFCDALFPQPLPAAAEQCFRLGEWVSQRAAGIGCLRLGAVNSSFTAVSDGALCVSHFLKGLKASAQPSILLTLSGITFKPALCFHSMMHSGEGQSILAELPYTAVTFALLLCRSITTVGPDRHCMSATAAVYTIGHK